MARRLLAMCRSYSCSAPSVPGVPSQATDLPLRKGIEQGVGEDLWGLGPGSICSPIALFFRTEAWTLACLYPLNAQNSAQRSEASNISQPATCQCSHLSSPAWGFHLKLQTRFLQRAIGVTDTKQDAEAGLTEGRDLEG
ncbi:hypothetical protein H8959_014908 [Pygathrix nigripes]